VATFSGEAAADVVRVNLSIPNYLVVQTFVDGGGPSAQAAVDSLGTSQAFASFPYPGETGVAATGLISTLTGLSLPSYPFIANSSFPISPSATIDQPGYHLAAHSGQSSSTSSATLGESTTSGSEGGAFATASAAIDDAGVLTSRAESRFGLAIGAVVIRGLDAVAQAVRSPGGQIHLTSSLTMGQIEVAGVGVELNAQGLALAGSPLIPASAINGAVNALTIGTTKLAYIPSSSTSDSVTSAGLRITASQMIAAIGHPVDVSYTLGNLTASADSTALSPVSPVVSVGPISVPLPLTSPATVSTAVALLSPVAPSTPTVQGPLAAASTPGAPAPASVVGVPLAVSKWSFFPILVVAGAVLLAGAFGSRAAKPAAKRGARSWSW
jgi:hypothetical protein